MTIDLKVFNRPRAVVDWISLRVTVTHKTNGWTIQDRCAAFGASYAEPVDAGPGKAANTFLVRVQEPDNLQALEAMIAMLEKEFGVVHPVKVHGIEVSLDFKPFAYDLDLLEEMTIKLMDSILPAAMVNPRLTVNRGSMLSSGLIMDCKSFKVNPNMTMVIGNKGDDLMWRVYLKRTNETFDDEGVRMPLPLPPAEQRVRAEVTIQGAALAEIGLTDFGDLNTLAFERLHSKDWFHFAKFKDTGEPMFTNPYSVEGSRGLDLSGKTPAVILDAFGRRDDHGRRRKHSRFLGADTELNEAARYALRGLTARFNGAHSSMREVATTS